MNEHDQIDAMAAEIERLRTALRHVVIEMERGHPLEAMRAALNALEGD